MHRVLTTCCFCACGCNLYLEVEDGRITGVIPSREHPITRGNLCLKGWHSYEFIHHRDRLQSPLIRRHGRFVKASWDEALDLVTARLLEIRDKYGAESLGVLSSAKCTNEENYLLMKLTRAVLKTNNIDHCARLCHSPSVIGLNNAFGSGAMTNSIAELAGAEVILVTGSNTTEQHPQIARFIFDALAKGARLIVVDPRRIPLSRFAHVYLQPRLGTDVIWLNGMMKMILDDGLADDTFIKMRTENFEAFTEMLRNFNIEDVVTISGIRLEDLRRAARMYASVKRAMIIYSMGITQHISGTDNVQSIANLAMLTGHVEQEWTGVGPLRGQNNVQGACDMGALPGTLSGYQNIADANIREKFENVWKTHLPTVPGLTGIGMFRSAGDKKVRGMFIMGENPALSHPDLRSTRAALKGMEFLAVSDIFLTETAELADVVLPAASFAEKDGTVTSTERRIQRLRKAISPVGESKPDWQILCELSSRMGYPMDYETPAEIMEEIAFLTPIYGGAYYNRLEHGWGLFWPCPNSHHPGTPFLHKGSFARGRGRFEYVRYRPPAEVPDDRFPFFLTTGRIYAHWHTGSMTRRVTALSREGPEAFVEINPKDAKTIGVRDGKPVRVFSRRGDITVKARLTRDVPEKTVFIPFHFAEAPANILTHYHCDPGADIPEFKVCAVRVESVQ
ncbi:MAG: formate dehydrogenase subunit alpha [Desulfobacterales bacterium C00003060]|nr:MAG: formate dehydrogenase subunit alpha [Desulfobacterales bacterium S3730MH5]OEU78666.1 MAG: formate dehydrogenase subunit alpha [Desulfobacterales bacterium S5133MH4]OEU81214.1 MAG: formate dehydrogenase subunit alpha [Desulfobacterales bacterium C00003060]